MNNEFDKNSEFDFEELEEFDGFEELNEEDIIPDTVRTAVLRKKDMVALLCFKSAADGAAICRVDPREEHPSVQVYDDPAKALEWFSKSLRTSKRNGWDVIYDGLPLQG
jgi:hypothetical protein